MMRFKTVVALLLCLVVFSTTAVSAGWVYASPLLPEVLQVFNLPVFPWVEIPEQEIDIVNQFGKILNNKVECAVTVNGTLYTESYDALIAGFDNSPTAYIGGKYISLHNNSYIGTMQTRGDDVKAIRDLFGEVLLNEENTTTEYSLMLKREAIDGKNMTGESYYLSGDHGWAEENKFYQGTEMILFSTNWTPSGTSGYVVVYATVYTRYPLVDEDGNYIYERDANGNIVCYSYQYKDASGKEYTVHTSYPKYVYGDWVKISGEDAFVGEAYVVNYSTGDSTRSFDTGTWRSSREYGGTLSRASLSAMVNSVLNGGK